jgi:hypothetical protein
MPSSQYLDFIGSVWENLPDVDKARLGELWFGYERVFASVYQTFMEARLNIAQQTMLPYSTQRWLPYTFDSATFVSQPAVVTSNQDLSLGINLAVRSSLYIKLNGGAPVLVNIQGLNPGSTKVTEIIAKINAAFNFKFAAGLFSNSILQLTSNISGLSSSIEILPTPNPMQDASEFVLGVMSPALYPKFPYIYSLPYGKAASIPTIQDKVRDESVTVFLQETTDYELLGNNLIAFAAEPPAAMWARRSLFDQENPWNNFGFLMGIYETNSPRYVDVLQGLWYAFWTGPTPNNVRNSLYLLFGLPTAQQNGVVSGLTATTITLTNADNTVSTFSIPGNLDAMVVLGQEVKKFDPLVTGIQVFDKVNSPGFITEQIGRAGIQRFLLPEATRGPGDTDETKAMRMLEEHCFLPQISVNAFINQDINLGNVTTFLNAIKPLSKTYLFQIVVGNFLDPLGLDDMADPSVDMDITENVDSNETTLQPSTVLLPYETNPNVGLNLDQNGVLLEESLEIDVYSFGVLVDSFTA